MKICNTILCAGVMTVMAMLVSCPDDVTEQVNYVECGNTTLRNPVAYTLTMKGRWTTTNFDKSLVPGGAHFSPIVIFTHTADERIFSSGEKASPGLEKLAEDGKTPIRDIANTRDNIACSYVGDGNLSNSGESKFGIQVDSSFDTVTVLSMIAPSSDWFVAVRLSLRDSNTFVNEGEADFLNYDAGTEQDDVPFSLGNAAEPVHKDISRLADPFKEDDVLITVSYKKNVQ